ncbi:MAG: AbgT family transporter [Tissierellia bacterium]|nr:AbgT family transporter [Tissierellia bacterium]
MSKKQTQQSKQEVKGFLKTVERLGNALPHPAMIFFILSLAIVLISGIVAKVGEPVTYFDARAGEKVTVEAVSLLNAEGLRYIFNSAVKNFTNFAPLGTVLVAMLGVGVAEWTGLINTSLRKLLTAVPPRLLTAIIVFTGIMSNIASDAGYVVVIPLGALLFASVGRHPIAGLAAAFAGVSGGFSANLVFGTTDALLAGITNEALRGVGIDYEVLTTGNWYFLVVSTFLLVILGTIITEKVVEKNLGPYNGKFKVTNEEVTAIENKGLRNAGIALLVYIVIMALLMLPNGPLRTPDAEGKLTLNEFLSNGLIPAILLLFLIPGLVYGKTTGKIKNSNDFVASMTDAMKSMGSYLVLAFFAAQFISYFSYSKIGTIISVKGAQFLESIGFTGLPLVIVFILITAFLNLFMASASAKWAIMAPIFVPMMFQLGLSPELVQVAYRIGDSTTNIITPLMSYFAMIVVFAQRYDEEAGLGTLISTMIPYSITFLIFWTILLAVWILFGWPLGPEGALLFV